MLEKLKFLILNDHIFFGLIIILVGISSFYLGRASLPVPALNEPKLQLQGAVADSDLSKPPLQSDTFKELEVMDEVLEEIVASKSGTKYHLVSCAGAKQIKPENKITFASRQAAEAAGYKPAADCPQLQ